MELVWRFGEAVIGSGSRRVHAKRLVCVHATLYPCAKQMVYLHSNFCNSSAFIVSKVYNRPSARIAYGLNGSGRHETHMTTPGAQKV